MHARFVPAISRPLKDMLSSFNCAFANYIGGEAKLNPETLHHFINREGVNLNLSRVAMVGDDPVGLALMARRGCRSRLATMGIVPNWQNQGIGSAFVVCLIKEAAARGDRSLELEVIEQNGPGLHVYRRAGMTAVQRLLEFDIYNPAGEADSALEPVDPAEAANQLVKYAPENLPWQLSGYTLVTLSPPNASYRLGPAYAMMTDPKREKITLYSLIVSPEARGRGYGLKLLRALFARHPDKHWHIPSICPEAYAPFFEAAGFRRGPSSQFQMRIDLVHGAASFTD